VTYSIPTTSYEHESYIYIYHRVSFKSNGVGCNFVMNGEKQSLWETEYRFRFKKNCNFFYETDYRIRFTMLWNGICIPFKKNCNFFCETDYRIRFTMLWNGICIPFPIHFDFFRGTTFVIRLVKVWNACHNPFHKRFRDIVYETENKFCFKSQTEKKKY